MSPQATVTSLYRVCKKAIDSTDYIEYINRSSKCNLKLNINCLYFLEQTASDILQFDITLRLLKDLSSLFTEGMVLCLV